MKRFSCLVATAVLVAVVLSACAKKDAPAAYQVDDVASHVTAASNIEGSSNFSEDDLKFTLNLSPETYEKFSGSYTTVNGNSGAVLVVQAKEGKVEEVKKAMETYRDGLVAQFENYKDDFPIGYEQNKNGRVVVKGDYAVLAIAGADVNYDDIDKAIDEALK